MGSVNCGIPEFLLIGQILHDDPTFWPSYGNMDGEFRSDRPATKRTTSGCSEKGLPRSSSGSCASKNLGTMFFRGRRGSAKPCTSASTGVSTILYPIEEAAEESPESTPRDPNNS